MDLGLRDCRAFVAGASRGLGLACAKALAHEGARVFICSRDARAIARAAAEIGAAGHAAADVSRPAEATRVVFEAVAALGGLDCLVTNAGGPPTAPFDKAGDGDWDIAYQLNLMSAVRLIREALPTLKASGRGRIVNLTGYGVKEPISDLVVSDSIRAGVTVMAKTIASDLAPYGITVNNIAPGPIMTDRITEILSARAKSSGISPDELFRRLSETIPVRRMGRPDEIGDLCAYLCSLQAGYLTGQTIVVDGGINRSIWRLPERALPATRRTAKLAQVSRQRGSAMGTATLSRLDVVPLSQHIGAEIRGIDLRDQLDAETVEAIHQAWLDHCVLLFRGQSFSQEDLIRVTGYFGEIAPLSRPPKFFPKGYSRLLPNIMMISNIRENGETIGALPDGEMHFHHDQIHSEIPHNGTLLYSLEIPSHGGDTLFASGYAAYDTLDPALKAEARRPPRLPPLQLRHHVRGGTMGIEAFAKSSHPVFRTHDETGRKAIYVNRLMTCGSTACRRRRATRCSARCSITRRIRSSSTATSGASAI